MKKFARRIPLIFFAVSCQLLNPSDPPIVLSTDELAAEFDRNVEAPELKYHGKALRITGQIFAIADRKVGMEIDFRPSATTTYVISRVLNEDQEEVAQMNKRDTITLLCLGEQAWDGKTDKYPKAISKITKPNYRGAIY